MAIFKNFERETQPDGTPGPFIDIVEANGTEVTTGIWSGDLGALPSGGVFLAEDSILAKTRDYYVDVYNIQPGSTTDPEGLAEVQFAITYGHINGGGSPTLQDNEQSTLPTKAIYSQYRSLLLNPADVKFTFEGKESDHIYVINLQRSRFKEQLDPGNWQLPLSGSNGFHCFIDDSGFTLSNASTLSGKSRVYRVVSGTLSGPNGVATASANFYKTFGENGPGYGLVYPDLGLIVLNPNAIGPAVGFWTSTGKSSVGGQALVSQTTPMYTTANLKNANDVFAPVTHSLNGYASTISSAYNHVALYHSINGAISGSSVTFREFRARSAETISSTHFFVRLRNREFNYSNNPTFFNETTNRFTIPSFSSNPQVYITTVGLYNDRNELLAVAKLSKPVRKSFDEEILLRVRLDF